MTSCTSDFFESSLAKSYLLKQQAVAWKRARRRWQASSYYYSLPELALEVRARHGLEGSHLTILQIWRICGTAGIERLDFRSGFKALRGAYFNDDYGVSILLARGLPDDPTVLTIAHELKHHLVDDPDDCTECRVELARVLAENQ